MKYPIRILFSFLITSLSIFGGSESHSIPLEAQNFESNQNVKFTSFDGRPAMELSGNFQNPGISTIKDIDFADGVIEFDMWIDFEKAVFGGLNFRIPKDEKDYERIYFRPGANHQYNCFQYYPHYNHQSTWQLYGHHQRILDLPHADWFHFKIVVSGSKMACFMEDQEYPFFFLDELQSGSKSGQIQFSASTHYYVSNLKVEVTDEPVDFDFTPESESLALNYLHQWSISESVVLGNEQEFLELSDFKSQWKSTIKAEDQGLISFTRHIKKANEHTAVLASTVIAADEAIEKQLMFGYSDRMDLYLNGERIYRGNNTYRTKTSKMRSRVHEGNSTVILKLKKGENKVQAVVYDRFGGWALVAKLNDLKGISK